MDPLRKKSHKSTFFSLFNPLNPADRGSCAESGKEEHRREIISTCKYYFIARSVIFGNSIDDRAKPLDRSGKVISSEIRTNPGAWECVAASFTIHEKFNCFINGWSLHADLWIRSCR